MIINGNNVNLDDLFDQGHMHKMCDNGIFISDIQKSILLKNGIDVDKCSSINELLFFIEEILNEDDDEELEIISKEIAEFNYYANTNK